MKNSIFVLIAFLGFSCAFHRGDLEVSSVDRPVVYQDIATGVSSSSRIFGIGGLGKDALVFEAKRNMIENRPLVGNEQYGNISVDIKQTFFLVGQKTKITVVADVVTLKESMDEESYSEIYLNKLNKGFEEDSLFAVGDSVYFKQDFEVVINNLISDKKATVSYLTKNNQYRTKIVLLKNLFANKHVVRGIKIGDKVKGGQVIGLGKNGFIIQVGEDVYYYDYDEVYGRKHK